MTFSTIDGNRKSTEKITDVIAGTRRECRPSTDNRIANTRIGYAAGRRPEVSPSGERGCKTRTPAHSRVPPAIKSNPSVTEFDHLRKSNAGSTRRL